MRLGAMDQQATQPAQAEPFIFKAAVLSEQAHRLEVAVLLVAMSQVEELRVVLRLLQVAPLDLREHPET